MWEKKWNATWVDACFPLWACPRTIACHLFDHYSTNCSNVKRFRALTSNPDGPNDEFFFRRHPSPLLFSLLIIPPAPRVQCQVFVPDASRLGRILKEHAFCVSQLELCQAQRETWSFLFDICFTTIRGELVHDRADTDPVFLPLHLWENMIHTWAPWKSWLRFPLETGSLQRIERATCVFPCARRMCVHNWGLSYRSDRVTRIETAEGMQKVNGWTYIWYRLEPLLGLAREVVFTRGAPG